jgi:TPP-dependent 2-oxoacid decarboxylase
MATSGPGATNLVTAIADAYVDSCPLIAITGQVAQSMIGRGAFQETDMIGVTLPIVKHSYLITDINAIPRIVKEAFYIAQSGRPGPVVLDFPKNVQQQKARPVWPTLDEVKAGLRGYTDRVAADELALNEIIGLIEKSERPVIYSGGGIITSGASLELLQFAESAQIPLTTTLMGIGGFPEEHPLSLRWLGMHGAAFANWAVNGEYVHRKDPSEPMVKLKDGCDLLLAFGVVVWLRGRKSAHRSTRAAFNMMMMMLVLQVVIGIGAVLTAAQLHVALTHQVGAVVLWVLILRARHLSQYPRAGSIRKGTA